MKHHLLYLLLPLVLCPLSVFAQKIDFGRDIGYRSIGVYDTWEESPFRTGAIASPQRYVGLVANPDTSASNHESRRMPPGTKVLALQRSRFGSNTFGAQIDLSDTLRLGKSVRYVHLSIWRPQGETSDVMVIGLGKRGNWKNQSSTTEQFWVTSPLPSGSGRWSDLTFPVSAGESVEIHSLVVVPDLSSPHLRKADFIVYIGNIVIDEEMKNLRK
ncbi:MAG: hypothetical protein K6F94_00815 [Bacteroidaceae bacterium]|nr:hypothetical protein [Bacteroidaceae bacterium]